MASASRVTSSPDKKEGDNDTSNERRSQTNGNVENESLINDMHESLEVKKDEKKSRAVESGQHVEELNGENENVKDEKQPSLHERLNGNTEDENQRHEKVEENGEVDKSFVTVCAGDTIKNEKDDKLSKTTHQLAELAAENELKNHDSLVEDAANATTKTTNNIEIKENTTPPRSQPVHRHSPSSGSPERKNHTGGCHKFLDEESRVEYMKIKSEVTGEAETSESEDEEEGLTSEHAHHGSHTSPDSKTKAEYRKIKYEITGEALTSESEDENPVEGEKEQEETEKVSSEEWMDIFGNGLLKRRVSSNLFS